MMELAAGDHAPTCQPETPPQTKVATVPDPVVGLARLVSVAGLARLVLARLASVPDPVSPRNASQFVQPCRTWCHEVAIQAGG